jgi:hypothetical protein
MINATNLIYSKAAAARILGEMLGRIVKAVESIQKLANGAWQITYRTIFGRCSLIISKADFKKHFVEKRIAESKELYCSRISGNIFRVVNPKKGTAYSVFADIDGISCGCEDYKNQMIFLKGKGCCKHGYSLLKFLGYDRLSEYIEHHKWVDNSHPPHYSDEEIATAVESLFG